MSAADAIDVIRLDGGDEVVVASRDIRLGETVSVPGRGRVEVRSSVPRGHKLAITPVSAGDTVSKYGVVIGVASADIKPGDHVHIHNLTMTDPESDYEFGTARRTLPVPEGRRPTFDGYRRADGKVGTRNYIGILTSVNCSAGTAKMIADQFRGSALDEYTHVDGVVALTHGSGCGLVSGSDGADVLTRTLRGYAAHPNMAGLLVLGLGCEMLQADRIVDPTTLPESTLIETMTIQETGGIRKTVRAGVAAIEKMLGPVNDLQRESVDVSELTLGLNCGGSDGYSGITANPALGVASDLLVAYGGTSILAETPEVFGAEQLLTRRAVSPEVGRKLLKRIEWWKEYAAAGGGSLDNNPSPGNKAGGLTTILEKSLGAIAKSGSAELVDVLAYAEPVTARGLHFMDTPGYDPVSVTGIVAGGANIVCFTTGRGSVLGCKPSPSIKLATNSDLYARMREDMDLNCGGIVDGSESVDEAGRRIFDCVLEVASGRRTVSEELDLGQDEFQPWQLGTVT
ncbi:UxaA family hydrolase [Spelaeicoccus albus]|uniref:Altronate hydrolase n=1 Tax=Spelaeicoccus albus TaxID=1280376 RepID=A0A7Z0AAQ7_9MICO|nr:altronate dehydratase family protein [Spelaeicoccus albus]NYI66675.1 altronate hydrolase [Spelaeicoccus albus]